MMKKLLKITEIATLSKSAWFLSYLIYWSKILNSQIKDLKRDCVKISRPYHLYFSRNRLSMIVTVGSDQLKVLELYECRWCDPYMTASMNFVRLVHLLRVSKVNKVFSSSYYEWAKRMKFLLSVVYGSLHRHSNSSKIFKTIYK